MSDSINVINVGGIDKLLEDTDGRLETAAEVARLDARIDNIVAPSGGAPSAEEVQDARIGADEVTYNSLGLAIRTQFTNERNKTKEEIAGIRTDIRDVSENLILPSIEPYFYAYGYYDDDLDFRDDNDIATFKIPCQFPSFINILSNHVLHRARFEKYMITYELNDGSLTRNAPYSYLVVDDVSYVHKYQIFAAACQNCKYVYISLEKTNYETYKDEFVFCSGAWSKTSLRHLDESSPIIPITAKTTSLGYVYYNANLIDRIVPTESINVVALYFAVKAGDTLLNLPKINGLSFRGGFKREDGGNVIFDSETYICPEDGICYVFDYRDSSSGILLKPANRTKIAYSDIVDPHVAPLDPYYYRNGYYDENLKFVPHDAILTFRIPFSFPSVINIVSDSYLPLGLRSEIVLAYEMDDGTITRDVGASYRVSSIVSYVEKYNITALSCANCKYLYISLNRSEYEAYKHDIVVRMGKDLNQPSPVIPFTVKNASYGYNYFNNVGEIFDQISPTESVNAAALYFTAKAGDSLLNLSHVPGISFVGAFRKMDGTSVRIEDGTFVCPTDGIGYVFDNVENPIGILFQPVYRTKIRYMDIIDPLESDNYYHGLKCVAFGTSLTANARETAGYVTYLQQLSGMTIDNQGIGSSKIMGNLLTAVKNYSNWADKDICILEGFVNDWYYNPDDLGTWKDSTENTVCGCVRSALNHIRTQNSNATVFLILDHYGQGINLSTAVNSANKTQYEYYEEIAKVAESLGVIVIKLYAISEVSEKTPQYLVDNIHPNDLGAQQTGYCIWSQMKQCYPNK